MIAGRRQSVSGKTKEEVKRKRRELLANADKGLLPSSKQSLAEYMTWWLADVVKPSKPASTYRIYEQLTRLYIVPVLGNVKLAKLEPAYVQKLHAEMQAKGLSRNTVQRAHRVLHNALNRAVEWGYIPRNVATVVHPPTPEKGDMRVLDVRQSERLFEAARGTRWEALITLAIATSLRESELLGLKWADLDLERGKLTVQRKLSSLTRQLEDPKTPGTRRSMRLPTYATRALLAHRASQNEARLIKGGDYQDNGLVFATYDGKPLIARNVTREFKKLLERAGLPDVRFYDLRHTAATLMLLQGIPARVVQERLGHSQISLTLGTYSHVLPSMDDDAAARMDALFGGMVQRHTEAGS